ncbi:MAG: malate:quinone oxidoreductase [Flavobacteriaceae bacterium]|nr:malate:quinone oxidoreductase [Flavobacteriaceae bacterium]
MAAHYVSTIGDVLKEFQPGLNDEIYNALAWVGLKNTTAWNNLSPLEQARIKNLTKEFNLTDNETCVD